MDRGHSRAYRPAPTGSLALRLILLTIIAILAFAANSVLARLALATAETEGLGYTGIRLVSGAIMLALLLSLQRRNGASGGFRIAGNWVTAAALFGYALPFSIAYLRLGAGPGALILFATVQFGILGWAILKGDRPGLLEWLGLAVAFGALAYLVSPGLVAPDPLGTLLMVVAGLSWTVYTLLGRGSRAPLADTAGNFIRLAPIGIVLIGAGAIMQPPTAAGIAYAVASGALASGLGYAIWYAVLPALTRTRAALLQLTVPAIAAIGGVLLIAEPVTARLMLSSLGILGGVALALLAAQGRPVAKADHKGASR